MTPADDIGLRVSLPAGVTRGERLVFRLDGKEVVAFRGETVAAALFASGHRTLRATARRQEPRGVFCGMGVCFDCLMVIDGQPSQRACMTLVAPGMDVQTQVAEGPQG